MYVTIVQVQVKSEHIQDFIEAARLNHAGSVCEAGNRRFDVLQRADDPTKFVLYEAYASAEDATAHKNTAHYLAPSARGEHSGSLPWRSFFGESRMPLQGIRPTVSRLAAAENAAPREAAASRQWAQIAAMNYVPLGATAAVSERVAPRDPAAIWRDAVAPWMAVPRIGTPCQGLFPEAQGSGRSRPSLAFAALVLLHIASVGRSQLPASRDARPSLDSATDTTPGMEEVEPCLEHRPRMSEATKG